MHIICHIIIIIVTKQRDVFSRRRCQPQHDQFDNIRNLHTQQTMNREREREHPIYSNLISNNEKQLHFFLSNKGMEKKKYLTN